VNRGATGGDVRGLQREAAADAHQPRHQPPPADDARGRTPPTTTRSPAHEGLLLAGRRGRAGQQGPRPRDHHPRDAIERITSTAICGSDLHLYGGKVPSMQKGDILGHEFMAWSRRWGAACRT
jgi:hypothetical protein